MANLLATIKSVLKGQQQEPQQQPQPNPMQQAALTGLQQGQGPQSMTGANQQESVLDQLQYFMQNKDQGQQQTQAPRFNIPQEELGKIAKGQDFTKHISPEVMQRLQSGDPTAILEALNAVGQASYMTSLQHTMGLTDSFVDSRFQHEQTNLQGVVDQRLTNRGLDESLQHMHPYARDMFKKMASDFRKQFPDASEQDISDTTWAAFKEIGTQAGNDPTSVNQRQQAEKAAPNWDNFGGFEADAAPTPQGGQGPQ